MSPRPAIGAPGPRARVAWLIALVLLASCSPTPPRERLAEALDATLASSFAFEVLLEADQAALADLGEQAGGAASLLSGLRLHGVVAGDDTLLALDALGGTVVELRQLADGPTDRPVLFLRAGVVDLLARVGLEDLDAEARLLDQLVAADAPAEVLLAVVAAFDGRWVGLDGGLGPGLGAAAGLGPSPADDGPAPLATAFGTDLASFLDRFVEVSELDGGILHLELRLGDLLRAAAGLGAGLDVGREVLEGGLDDDLAALPARVPGDVRLGEGPDGPVVEELAFDVAEAARGLGRAVEGRVVLRIRVTRHGTAGPVTAPEDAVVLDADALEDAVAAILRSLGL